MKQLFDGVYLLEGDVGGRPLQLICLCGSEASLLLDTGCAGDPERFIAPQIREAGGDPQQLTWIVNTHSDSDHTGGNHEMKKLAPQALLACGDADREACSGPGAIMRLRYDAYREPDGMFYDGEARAATIRQCGHDEPIQVTLVGGERIRLGPGWDLRVLALPGHSHGHLGLWDERNAALYGGDAIHGRVYLGLDGAPKLPPTYLHVDEYLATVRLIETLPITTYVGCHWPVQRGAEIGQFCAETRQFVEWVDGVVRSELAAGPCTLRELCLAVGPQVGEWPRGVDTELMYALKGHLVALAARGLVEVEKREGEPARYRLHKA